MPVSPAPGQLTPTLPVAKLFYSRDTNSYYHCTSSAHTHTHTHTHTNILQSSLSLITATTTKPVLYPKKQKEEEDETTSKNNEKENEKYINEVLDVKVEQITINKNSNSGDGDDDDDDTNNLDIQDSDLIIKKNLNRIHMKKKLLLRLLQGTNQELEYYQMHAAVGFESSLVEPNNDNYGSTVISYQEEEERMLNNKSSSNNNSNGSSYSTICSPSSYSINTVRKLY